MLQFKDEIGIVKCFTDEPKAHGLDAGEHTLFYLIEAERIIPELEQF